MERKEKKLAEDREDREDRAKSFILIGLPSVTFSGVCVARGDEISEAQLSKVSKGFRFYFAEKGSDLAPGVFDKLPQKIQRHFKRKA